MPILVRKILAVPYVRLPGKLKTRFLVVRDQESKEWTFISGTCEPGERAAKCVLRELWEETRGLVELPKLPARTKQFRLVRENKQVDVFIIPLRLKDEEMRTMVRQFYETEGGDLPEEFLENDRIVFETMAQFRRRKDIWPWAHGIIESEEFEQRLPRNA